MKGCLQLAACGFAVLGLAATAAVSADQPPKASSPKLSDDGKNFITCCNQRMERDYEDEVSIRIAKTWNPFHKINSSIGEQERILRGWQKTGANKSRV
jgi:hypothetical protein